MVFLAVSMFFYGKCKGSLWNFCLLSSECSTKNIRIFALVDSDVFPRGLMFVVLCLLSLQFAEIFFCILKVLWGIDSDGFDV